MSNLSSLDDLTFDQNEIDDLWHNINSAPTDRVSYWISIASFVFALLGSISNLMSVIVLLRLSTQLSTFIYLTGLSLSDMITCISIIMTYTLEFIVQTRSTSITIFLRYIDIIFGALAAGSRVLSLWISTAVTMDRWILICYPIYGKQFCTLKRAKIVSRTLFFIAFLYSVPLFFEYEVIQMPSVYQTIHFVNESSSLFDEKLSKNNMLVTKGYSDLAKRRLYRWAYMFFNAIFVYSLPTITIVFFNLQLISALHRLKSRSKLLREKSETLNSNQKHRRSHQSKYSVTIMVIAMVLTLLICRSPTIVLWVLWSFELTIKIFFDSSSSSGVRRFHNIANLIAIINAATNFLPFCVFGQLFRAECLNIYGCRKPTSKQLAKQARRKYEENYPQLANSQRTKATTYTEQATTNSNGHLRTVISYNSEITSGITSSSIHSSAIYSPTNIIRLSEIPPNQGQQQHSRFSFITTPLIKETTYL